MVFKHSALSSSGRQLALHGSRLAGRPNLALPHGGYWMAIRRAGSVWPQAGVIIRSWTDVHSLTLPWPSRKQLLARGI